MLCKLQRDATVGRVRKEAVKSFPHPKVRGERRRTEFSTPENDENLHQLLKSCPICSNEGSFDSSYRAGDNSIRIVVIRCVVVEIFQKPSFLGWRLFFFRSPSTASLLYLTSCAIREPLRAVHCAFPNRGRERGSKFAGKD